MKRSDCYRILSLPEGASGNEIKRAYRRLAMEYHPDRNHSPGARDMFIQVTEAYQHLTYRQSGSTINAEQARENYEAWRVYRQAEARRRAEAFARASSEEFRKSDLYRSTHITDVTMVILGLILSLAVMSMALYGYRLRMQSAVTPEEEPSLIFAVVTFLVGLLFLVISLASLSIWLSQKKNKNRFYYESKKKNKESV